MVQLRVKYFEAKIKKTLALVTAGAVLLFLALLAIPRLVDVNNYKADIISLLNEQTGFNFEIAGDMSLTVLPDLGISLHEINVSGPIFPDVVESASVHIKEFSLRLKFLPLLKGKFEFDTVILNHPVVTLLMAKENGASKAKKKKTQVIVPESQESTAIGIAGNESVPGKTTVLEPFAQALAIKEFRIYEGEIEIKDAPVRLKDIEIRAALASTQAPFNIKAVIVRAEKEHVVAVEGTLTLNDRQYVAEKFLAQLDDIQGYGKVDINLRPALPDVKILLNIERLNLDPYLASTGEGNNGVEGASKHKANDKAAFSWSKTPVSFAFLKEANAHVNVSVGAVHYQELKFKDIASNTHMGHGRLTSELKFGVVEGQVSGKLTVDATSPVPLLEPVLTIEQLDLAAVPGSWTMRKKLSGTVNASLGLNTTGNSMSEWISHLNGEGILNVMQGKIKGIDLKNMAKNVTSVFQGIGKEDLVTEFDKIHASFSVNQGIVQNDDLAIEMDIVRFSGQGEINLPEMAIDYRLTSKLEIAGSKEDAMSLPIMIKGSLLHPQFAPDLASSVIDLVTDPDKAGRLMDSLKDGLKGTKGNIKKDLQQELQNLVPKAF
jgi:uncharacterized protein involved in outer membrane biogenesis